MKHFAKAIAATMFVVLLTVAASAETISPEEADLRVGSFATVEGHVSQVSTSSGGTTFINFGGRYPDHVFYAVIFKNRASRFPGVHGLEGRVIAISGAIERYKGKPQIILNSPEQINVREQTALARMRSTPRYN